MAPFQINGVFFFHHPNASSSAQAASELGTREAQWGWRGDRNMQTGGNQR